MSGGGCGRGSRLAALPSAVIALPTAGPARKSWIMQATSTDGVRIEFETVGHGHPLVLLHGFFGDRTSWRSAGYIDALAAKFSLILIDTRPRPWWQ